MEFDEQGKEKIIDDAGYIHIKWHIDDVKATAKNMNVSISDDDGRVILEDIYWGNYVKNDINWEVIETYIDLRFAYRNNDINWEDERENVQ